MKSTTYLSTSHLQQTMLNNTTCPVCLYIHVMKTQALFWSGKVVFFLRKTQSVSRLETYLGFSSVAVVIYHHLQSHASAEELYSL